MAINPHNRYPGQTAAPSPAYPYGNARNQTVPGDRRGTPLERTWVSDLWGFLQAILTEAGITPSGTPDAANNSQYLSGLKKILSLQSLFDRAAADQGTPGSAQIEGELLKLLHSTVAKIEAANVDGGGDPLGRATLRSGAGGDHPQAIASSIEGEVYAGINSRADTERSWLTLRGALREILGINKAGAAAPISVPNGLTVGTSFMPPAGYLPGAPTSFTSPGSHHLWLPAGARGVLVEVCGGGGGGEGGTDTAVAVAGGGGEYCKGFVSWPTPAGPNEIEAVIYVGGGASPNQDGENSSVEIAGPSGSFANITVQGGGSDGAGGSLPSPTFVGFRAPGHPGVRSRKGSGDYGENRWNLSGGASGAGWSYGRGRDIGLAGSFTLSSGGAAILIPHF